LGIYRPAANCKMNEYDADAPFCPVCEETLALGLLNRIGMNNAPSYATITLEVTYLWPCTLEGQFYTVRAPLAAGSHATIELPVVRWAGGADSQTTKVQVSVVRAAIPDYRFEMQRLPDPPIEGEIIEVEQDAVVQLTVRPAPDAPLSALLRQNLAQRVTLSFSQCLELDLEDPTGLAQYPAVGSRIDREVDPATGDVGFDLTLEAKSGAGRNLDYRTFTGFVIQPASGEGLCVWKEDPPDAVTVHRVTSSDDLLGLPPGKYTWSVLSSVSPGSIESDEVQLGRSGDFHFELREVQVAPYTTLPEPLWIRIEVSNVELPETVLLPVDHVIPADSDLHEVEPRPGLLDRIWELIEIYPDILEPERQPGPLKPQAVLPLDHTTPVSVRAKAFLDRRLKSGRTVAGRSAFDLPISHVRVYAEQLAAGTGVLPSYSGGAAKTFATSVAPLLAQTCVAFAYHPQGKPMRFAFEFKNEYDSFDGDGLVHSAMVSPKEPHSFLVSARVSLEDGRLPDDLGQRFKVRVKTIDAEGRESPWLFERALSRWTS